MPPVTKAGNDAFRKDVDFVTKDDDEQIAAGIVMVPDKADLQNDFAREGTIRGFADQFATFYEAGEAGGGVMHAVWPDDWMALERNEVLDEAEDIGGKTVEAGAWVQEWRINNADLWELIADDVLAGYSIGAIQVDWDGPYEQDELDDVAVPDALGDELVWELTDGIIREVSTVDIPAVPDAEILQTKADAEKRLGDYLGDPDGFVEEALQRGHTEAEAERLWDVLNAAVDAEGSAEPGKQSAFRRAGKAFLSALTGSDDDTTPSTSEAPDKDATDTRDTDKAGRTLSTENRNSLFATIDATVDVLENAGVDHGITRFTDREGTDFDLTEHRAREWGDGGDDDPDDDDEDDESTVDNHAPGGETPDNGGTTAADDMSDDNTNDSDAPEWAKAIQEQLDEQAQRIDDLADGSDKTAADDDADPMDDAPEWAKSLKEEVDKQGERIDAISQQSGYSDQLKSSDGGENNDDSGLGGLGAALS